MRDLAALNAWIDRWERKLSRLFSGAFLENASVTGGQLRIIGGTLRVDSGGRVSIVGTLQIDGTTEVTGTFNVRGPWNLTGNGDISGNVRITGKVTQVGDMDVDGKFTLRGSGWSITGNGEITGDVALRGTMRVQGGRIEVGDVVLSEANGGSLAAPVQIVINTPLLDLVGGIHVPQGAVFDGGITATGLLPISQSNAPEGAFVGAVYRDGIGRLRVVTPG